MSNFRKDRREPWQVRVFLAALTWPFCATWIACAAQADDTYAPLAGRRDAIVLDRDFGFAKYRNYSPPDRACFDATRARWNFQTFPEVKQAYPVDIRGGADLYWAGGLIVGLNPREAGWRETYDVSNGAGILVGRKQNPRMTIDGLRIHNVWDGIRVVDAPGFTIRNCWLTHIRDDAVENDFMNAGRIEDCLFDGCYAGISCRSDKDGSANVLVIENCLIRLQPFAKPHAMERYHRDPGHAMFFKWAGARGCKLVLRNNLFMAEQKGNCPDETMGVPPTNLVEGRDNVMVWLGEGHYPAALPDCFTVSSDRSRWDQAVVDWIRRHPKIPRLHDDPPGAADPARSTSSRVSPIKLIAIGGPGDRWCPHRAAPGLGYGPRRTEGTRGQGRPRLAEIPATDKLAVTALLSADRDSAVQAAD